MKRAINIAILATFVFIAGFGYTQTVVNKDNGLFLASGTIPSTSEASSTENSVEDLKPTIPNIISIPESPTPQASTTAVDEGKLPLWTNRVASDSQPMGPISNPITTTLSVIASLIGLIIVALGLSWFIQKKSGFGSNDFGKTLGIIPLDGKHYLYIVDVMGRMLVLGVTDSNINLLTEITDKDTIDAFRLKYGQSRTPYIDKLFPFIAKQEDAANFPKDQYPDVVIEDTKPQQNQSTIDSENPTSIHSKNISRLTDMIIKK